MGFPTHFNLNHTFFYPLLRERLAESLLLDGHNYKYDISLPLSVFYQAVLDMRARLGKTKLDCSRAVCKSNHTSGYTLDEVYKKCKQYVNMIFVKIYSVQNNDKV